MPDVTLAEGREITIDLSKFTRREYMALFDATSKRDEETLAKAAGLTVEQVLDLSELDYKKLVEALIAKVQKPLANPN